ncbi:DUF3515 family protein [Micromonospora arborensis]|uniref:DUF3515 family protein n=1 Tax=Micromonospora arborensis TaxID=2116518 RepID=UPI0033D8A1BB
MDKINRQARWLATAISLPITALIVGGALFAARAGDPVGEPPVSIPRARPYPSTPVPLKLPRLAGRALTICPALVSRLPPSLPGMPQRPVADGTTQSAAYGEPAITIVCGASSPKIEPTDTLFRLDGVCWHSIDQEDATVWTTADREVAVQLTVPREYQAPMEHASHRPSTGEATGAIGFLAGYGKWAIRFSPAVVSAVPSLGHLPSGCTN